MPVRFEIFRISPKRFPLSASTEAGFAGVQLDSGELVNVEMQAFPHSGFLERILLYWAKNYSSQLKSGEQYQKLCPVYSLIFSEFDLFSETNQFYNSFSIRRDTSPYFRFNQDLSLVTVELSKFKKKDIPTLLDSREEWCSFFE